MGTANQLKSIHLTQANGTDITVLDAAGLNAVLTPARCLAALDDTYRRLHAAPDDKRRSIGFPTRDGTFHVKAGLYPGSHRYFAAKVNANFPGNPQRGELPTIQGLIVLCDGADGRPLAVMDSGELTGLRTAAATALAAKHGAPPDGGNLAIIGCGGQARHQVAALMNILPIRAITAADARPEASKAFADWAASAFSIPVRASESIAEAVRDSDMIITCTTATRPFLCRDHVRDGCFIAAVGADNPGKNELAPDLFTHARVLVDDAAQCSEGGDLAHAVRAGTARIEDVAATLAELAAGAQPGRTSSDEIVIFDSTGTGVQDVAVAAAAYEAVGLKV